MPDIDPGLLDIWECVTACDSQVRASTGGAYALDWAVVLSAAHAFGACVTPRFFRLLRIYEATMLAAISKQ